MAEPVKEPVQTIQTGKQGRPEYSDAQYWAWLEELRPWLELSMSLYAACMRAGIETHYTVIKEKYKAGGVFAAKIDAYRSKPGESVNEALVRLTNIALDRVKRQEIISKEELDTLKFMADKHRTAQPFFVNRTETAEAKPDEVGKVLDVLEATDYAEFGREAQKQMVEANPPIQDQGQGGEARNVSPEPNTTPTPGGAGSPSV